MLSKGYLIYMTFLELGILVLGCHYTDIYTAGLVVILVLVTGIKLAASQILG
jgi:hypothetical protein